MSMLDLLTYIRYAFALIFGVTVTMQFGGVLNTKKDIIRIVFPSLMIGGIQILFVSLFGIEFTTYTYPFHTHLVLVLLMILRYHCKPLNAVIATFMAYMCCQIPAWVSKVGALAAGNAGLIIEVILYFIAAIGTIDVIRQFWMKEIRELMEGDRTMRALLVLIPGIYYGFDYMTTKWSGLLYSGNYLVVQFMPLVSCVIFFVFVSAYGIEQRKKMEEHENAILIQQQLSIAENEFDVLREKQEMARVYRHDMRHHLAYISYLADKGQLDEIKSYIEENVANIDRITPKTFCDIDILNLLLSHFAELADYDKVIYKFEIDLPRKLPLLNTELCAIVSNSLENAINALELEPEEKRRLDMKLCVYNEMLVFSVDNSCSRGAAFEDGLPTTGRSDHGFGTKSIKTIAEDHGGFASFDLVDDVFRVLVNIPM